jgi:hypothetical protein
MRDLDDFRCTFRKEFSRETILVRVGLKLGRWCLGCLSREAADLEIAYTSAMKTLGESLLRRGEEIAASTKLSKDHDDLLQKYMDISQKNIELTEKLRKK